MAPRKGKTPAARTPQQPLRSTPTPPIGPTPPPTAAAPARPTRAAADLRRAARFAGQTQRQAEACAKVAALPVQHPHAAGIDVGDASHWVRVETTPEGGDTVREFPAHTAGLRQLVACGRTDQADAQSDVRQTGRNGDQDNAGLVVEECGNARVSRRPFA